MIMEMKTIGINNMIQKIKSIFLFLTLLSFYSCSNDENPITNAFDKDKQTINYCRAFVNIQSEKYSDESSTRAISEDWNDGETIYISLNGNDIKSEGKVVYNKSDNSWTLYYEGILPNGEYSGTAYYIRGATTSNNSIISFNTETPVYIDTKISCQRESESVWISVVLHPQTGRIRFRGTANKSIKISGVWNYISFDIPNKNLSKSQSPIELSINADGYTPYCYCSFPQDSRTMSVAYDNYLFTTVCEHPILDAAQAGYMDLPTEEHHNGWDMSIVSLPSISDVYISNIGTHQATFSSSIINNGNATISDCGFCYSTTANPTIDDVRISYGTPTGRDFAKSITGFTDNTTYYVRAYAINELGVAYSQDKEFTTIAVTLSELSSVSVNTEEGKGNADFSAVITSDGHSNITECGFVYSTNEMPTLANNKVLSNSKPNLFYSVNNLTVGKRYYVRAFASNEKGTAYGQQVSFIAGGGKPGDDDINRPIL